MSPRRIRVYLSLNRTIHGLCGVWNKVRSGLECINDSRKLRSVLVWLMYAYTRCVCCVIWILSLPYCICGLCDC